MVPFEYADVVSSNISRGLRPHGSPELPVPSAETYFSTIAEAGIVVDRDERQQQIAEGLQQVAATVGGRVLVDEALLDEVTDLVEQPLPLLGRFDPAFLELPTPVLITVMKKHQRYFPVVAVDRETGRSGNREIGKSGDYDQSTNLPIYQSTNLPTPNLLPYFITVANGTDRDPDLVTRGNEAVIRARYADAAYFVRDDRKRPLEDFNAHLATLTFQEQLGSMLAKVYRLEKLTPEVADKLGLTDEDKTFATRAALLSKADLATNMVVEMTSLQGVMGEIYALASGEAPAVAHAIREAYIVRPETEISLPGLALNLANRLDSLAGLFAVNLAPRSTADPFGLRRDALGIVQHLIAAEYAFDVKAGLRAAAKLQPVPVSDEVIEQAAAFVRRRLFGVLRDEGFEHDVVEAVLAEQGDNPALARQAVVDLSAAVAESDWMDAFTAYARSKRIVRNLDESYALNAGAYVEDATRTLHNTYESVAPTIVDVPSLVQALRVLQPAIDIFFDAVLVMADDPDLRAARLALLQRIAALPNGIADLALLKGF